MTAHSPAEQVNWSEPLISRRPWFVALLLATVATPAGVVLAWLAPRPLDAVVALPLVLVDMWVEAVTAESPGNAGPILRVLLLVLGIALTWLLYVVAARLVLWRFLRRADEDTDRGPR